MGVKGEELLVRLPPDRHGEFQRCRTPANSPGGGMRYFWVEPNLAYATRAQWRFLADKPWPTTRGPRHRRAASPRQPKR